MSKQLRSFAAALALTATLASCGSNDQTAETSAPAANTTNPADSIAAQAGDSARMAKKGGVMVDGVAMTGDKTIVQNASSAKSVSTLVKLVGDAGLAETLSGPGPFTVFAPTNAAFDKLPKAALTELTAEANKAKLAGLLKYHVIPGRLVAADIKDGQVITTLNGDKLHFSIKDGKVLVSNGKDAPATVQTADVIDSNGVTHLIDTVVLPLEQ